MVSTLAAAFVALHSALDAGAVSVGGPSRQTTPCLPLEPRNPDGNYIVPGTLGDVVYRRIADSPLALDLYAPSDGERRPLVVVVHGGSFEAGSRVTHVGQFLELLTRAGYAWASIDYRLSGVAGWQDAVKDLAAAVDFIRCHAEALGVDPTRLVLMGEDTGATMAAHVAASSEALAGTILIGGRYDLAGAGGGDEASARRELSLVRPVGTGPRPRGRVLVVHGTADSEAPIDKARRFCDALGDRCDLVAVEGGIHRPENWRPGQWDYKNRVTEWLSDVVAPGVPATSAPLPRDWARGSLEKGVVYGDNAGMTLDAWIPNGAGPHVPVLIAHGGGWEAGDRVTYVTPLFEPLAKAGFAWFSIDYRLTPEVRHPAQLDDLRAAIRFLRTEATRFRIDPARLVILGESASGQMVTQVGVTDGGVAGVVSFYGVYDFLPMAKSVAPGSVPARLFGITRLDDEARRTLRRFSPIYHVRADQPPLLLIHGTDESLWAQGQAMAARLAAVGAEHELLAVEGAPHGIENWEGWPAWQQYKTKLVDWIAKLPSRAE
jgi:acetyl esterase